MKKILICLLTLLLFSGCMHNVRLSKRAVVQTLGLDWLDNEYLATIQFYSLNNDSTETITAKGKSLSNLFEEASVQQGRQLFLGNLRLVIFGESLIRHGIEDEPEFLYKQNRTNPTTPLAIAQGNAKNLMEIFDDGKLPDIIDRAQKNGITVESHLMDLKRNQNLILPLISIDQSNFPATVLFSQFDFFFH